MYKITTYFLTFLILAGFAAAEEIEIDLGAGYAYDVWYHPAKGITKTEPQDNWDIAFQVDARNAGIRINGSKGILLWAVPGSSPEDFGSELDTNGMATEWDRLYNSNDSWNIGAFNMGKDGFLTDGDFGWGNYDILSHGVTGNKLFVLWLVEDAQYKVILIEEMINSTYKVKWSDLDGNYQQSVEISKNDYENKNYAYMNFNPGELLDREPNMNSWSFVFSKYITMIETQQGDIPYAVTGALTNPYYKVAEVSGIPADEAEAPEFNIQNYSSVISTIGSDWKSFNNTTFEYEIPEDRSYFISMNDFDVSEPNIDKIVFTEFEGSSTGKLKFVLNGSVSSVIENSFAGNVDVYPNVVSANDLVRIDLNNLSISNAELKIIDLAGNTILSKEFLTDSETYIRLPDATPGMYLIHIYSGSNLFSGKLFVQ